VAPARNRAEESALACSAAGFGVPAELFWATATPAEHGTIAAAAARIAIGMNFIFCIVFGLYLQIEKLHSTLTSQNQFIGPDSFCIRKKVVDQFETKFVILSEEGRDFWPS
jgi:hypothetical protein